MSPSFRFEFEFLHYLSLINFPILLQVNQQPGRPATLSDLRIDVNAMARNMPPVPPSSPIYGKSGPPSVTSDAPYMMASGRPLPSKMSDPNMFTPGPHTLPVSSEFSSLGWGN